MNNNITLDSSYKKAIELAGVKGNINNIDTKILIKESNAEYGIDYKKIISSTPFKQGDYVLINGVQYLIVDTEEQMSQSIYNVGTFRKTLPILLCSNYKSVQAIVDRNKISIVSTEGIQADYDQYNFIIPKFENYVSINNEIAWNGFIYTIISIDSTKEGIFVITGKQTDVYNPHIYTITLNSNSEALQETETYQLTATATDNETTVSAPTLVWKSSDETIATVNNGLVTALKVGTVQIIVEYMNISAVCNLTITVKPVTPVISYSENWSQTTNIKQYVTSTYTVTRNADGVVETPLIDYTFDSAGQALISSSKIVVIRKANNSFSVKNSTITTTTTCYVTIIDHSNGHVIANQLLTFVKGV